MAAPTQELIDALWHDDVRSARRLAPEIKLILGARLFDYACSIARAGIRHQHPDATEERVEEILRERFALADRMEQRS